jgi:hypothetical protein
MELHCENNFCCHGILALIVKDELVYCTLLSDVTSSGATTSLFESFGLPQLLPYI